jgi:hypothetical protein
MKRAAVIIVLLSSSALISAQPAIEHPPAPSASPAPLLDIAGAVESSGKIGALIPPRIERMAPRRWEPIYDDLWLDYEAGALKHRLFSLWWQAIASVVILIVVLGLVLFGAVLSYLQFTKGISSGDASTLGISLEKIEISSSVLGLLVLVISFLFFYVSVDKVYKLQELGTKEMPAQMVPLSAPLSPSPPS